MSQDTLTIVLLVAPILIGAIFAAVNGDGINNATEKVEAWFRRTRLKVGGKNGWFSSYVIYPILWMIVKVCDWTDSFSHRGLKSGVRVGATLYLFALWCLLIYFAVLVVLAIVFVGVVLYVIFKILGSGSGGSHVEYSSPKRKERIVPDYVGLKGKKIYSGSSWLTEDLKGRVDDDGIIYRGSSWLSEERIGRIDADGTIYEGTSSFNETRVGRIEEDGTVQQGTNWFNEERTGRIDKDGDIHKGSSWLNEEKQGRTGK